MLMRIPLFLVLGTAYLFLACTAPRNVSPSHTPQRVSQAAPPRSATLGMAGGASSHRQQHFQEAIRGLKFDNGLIERAPGWQQVLAERAPGQDAQTLRTSGNEHLNRNVPVRAIESYKLAVLREPGNPQGYHDLGRALVAAQQSDKAIAAFQSALQRDGSRHETRFSLAMCHWRVRDHEKTEEQFRELILRDPLNGRAHGRLAIHLYYRQRYAEA